MRLGAVLLASGSGRRFGGNKLLAPVEGVPLVERAMDALPPALFARAAVCTSYPEILALAEARGYLALENPRAAEGISASIRLGLSALGEVDGALFAVCDQPFLKTDSILRLIDAFTESPGSICALAWDGERGNPVVFPRDLFPELLALSGDTGGGAVLRAHRDRVALVEASSPRELRDVDAPEDLLTEKEPGL